jgi:hypothetical protein
LCNAGSAATPGPDQARTLQLAIGPGDGADRQPEIARELPQGGQSLTLNELSALDQLG